MPMRRLRELSGHLVYRARLNWGGMNNDVLSQYSIIGVFDWRENTAAEAAAPRWN
jgi:hypothetical protein